MKLLVKKSMLLIMILLVVVSLTACGGGSSTSGDDNNAVTDDTTQTAQPLELKIALEEIKGDPEAVYAEKFKEVLEQKSNGNITVSIYYLGQLGDGTDQVDYARMVQLK